MRFHILNIYLNFYNPFAFDWNRKLPWKIGGLQDPPRGSVSSATVGLTGISGRYHQEQTHEDRPPHPGPDEITSHPSPQFYVAVIGVGHVDELLDPESKKRLFRVSLMENR